MTNYGNTSEFLDLKHFCIKKAYLGLIKGQEEIRGPREDAPGTINEVIPGRNRIRVGFQHGGSLHQLGARILHPVVNDERIIND